MERSEFGSRVVGRTMWCVVCGVWCVVCGMFSVVVCGLLFAVVRGLCALTNHKKNKGLRTKQKLNWVSY